MTEEVRAYMHTKTDFLYENYEVSGPGLQAVKRFEQEIEAIAERSATPQDFETAYANGGYYQKFNDLIMKLPVRNRKLTKEEKQAARALVKENKEELKQFAKEEMQKHVDAANDAVDLAKENAPIIAGGLVGSVVANATSDTLVDVVTYDDFRRNRDRDKLREDIELNIEGKFAAAAGNLFDRFKKKKKGE